MQNPVFSNLLRTHFPFKSRLKFSAYPINFPVTPGFQMNSIIAGRPMIYGEIGVTTAAFPADESL